MASYIEEQLEHAREQRQKIKEQEIEELFHKKEPLTVKELANIMAYKANNIKAHIPADVFVQAAIYFVKEDIKQDIINRSLKIYTDSDPGFKEYLECRFAEDKVEE